MVKLIINTVISYKRKEDTMKICWLMIIVLVIPAYCSAMDSQLYIDGVYVSIGMEKNVVVKAFEKTHKFTKLPMGDKYLVVSNSSDSNVVGSISFENDKLSAADVSWGSYNGEEYYKFGNSLYGVLNSVISSGGNIKTIKIRQQIVSNMSNYYITFVFESRSIELLIYDIKDKVKGITIQENLN